MLQTKKIYFLMLLSYLHCIQVNLSPFQVNKPDRIHMGPMRFWPLLLFFTVLNFKGSSDPSHFIFEIKVGKSRIRHRTRFLPTLISNIKWLGPELPLNECVKWFHWNRRKSCLNMSTVISNCQIQLYSSPMVASFLIFFRRAWFYGYPAIGIFRSNSGIVASIRLI